MREDKSRLSDVILLVERQSSDHWAAKSGKFPVKHKLIYRGFNPSDTSSNTQKKFHPPGWVALSLYKTSWVSQSIRTVYLLQFLGLRPKLMIRYLQK